MLNIEKLGVVIHPKDDNHAKYNAGMIRVGNEAHMLYRWSCVRKNEFNKASGYYMDFIAHAKLDLDGKLIIDDDKPVIYPSCEWDKCGCQDPRIVEFEGFYYIFFCCWNLEVARVGIARTADFVTYERLGIIPSLMWDKDAFIFPERINGKIAYIHRIEPDIQIDYFDTFEDMLKEEYWSEYDKKVKDKVILKGIEKWENLKIGGSVPPIKTDIGWLLIYHGVGNDIDPFCYRAGAALLDSDDPSIVKARLPYPLFEPDQSYEICGDTDYVVFPQGYFINNQWLYISYGAADKVTAVARLKLEELIEELKQYIF